MDYLTNIVESIKPMLKRYGFKKKDLNWICETKHVVKIFNIQKSLYGKQIYLNLGIFIKQLEADVKYLQNKCHIQTRLDDLIGKNILDFENNIDIPKRSIALEKLIASNPFKFFYFRRND